MAEEKKVEKKVVNEPKPKKGTSEKDSKDIIKQDNKKDGEKKEEKTKEVKKKKKKKFEPVKKDVAVAKATSLKISPKHAFAVCKVIKGKNPTSAISRLEAVVSGKRPVPMAAREVAHQRGKGIAGAKFPKKACIEIIKVIKQAEANAIIAGIENPIIMIAKADKASPPFRRGGRRGKRAHIYLEIKDKSKLTGDKK